MITNTGKAILAKYLIGQSPSYASHIAIGCGAKPLSSGASFGDYSDKESLDFEMFRVPILSRGFVDDGSGNTSVVLTAELPTEERYEITEVGIFSAGSNPSAGSRDSKTLFSFSRTEGWEYHAEDVATSIPVYIDALNDNASGTNPAKTDIDFRVDGVQPPVFQTNSSNVAFTLANRVNRKERCRFLDNMIMLAGDEASISPTFVEQDGSSHIHLTGINIPLDQNSATDELRVALSVINRIESAGNPESVRLLIDFRSTESSSISAQFARFEIELIEGINGVDFATNRYFSVSKKLEDLIKSPIFSWSSMSVAKISASAIKKNANPVTISIATPGVISSTAHGLQDGQSILFKTTGTLPTGITPGVWYFVRNRTDNTFQVSETINGPVVNTSGSQSGTHSFEVASDEWYVAIDAIRLENLTTKNPLYGLTGYSVVKTSDGNPIIKGPNTTNLVEFRFGISVGGT